MKKILTILFSIFFIISVFSQKLDTLEIIRSYTKSNENADWKYNGQSYFIGDNNIRKKYIKSKNSKDKLRQVEYFSNNKKDSLILFLSHQILVYIYKSDSLTFKTVWLIDSNLNRKTFQSKEIIKKLKCGAEAKYNEYSSPSLYNCKKDAYKNHKTIFYCNNKKILENTRKNNNSKKIDITEQVYFKTKNNLLLEKKIKRKGDVRIKNELYKYSYNDTLLIEEDINKGNYKSIIKYKYDNNKLIEKTYLSTINNIIEKINYEYYNNGLLEKETIFKNNKNKNKLEKQKETIYKYNSNNKILEEIITTYDFYNKITSYLKKEYDYK